MSRHERLSLSMNRRTPDNSVVKNLPAMQETGALSLGQENLREKGMATHSSICTWEIPWQAIVHGVVKELDTT